MKNKIAYLLIMLFMVFAVVACSDETNENKGNYTVIEEADSNAAHVKTDKYYYNKEDIIKVYNYNASKEDYVCLLGPNDEPITVDRHLRSKTNTEVDEFSVSELIEYSTGNGYGEYSVCLYDADYLTIYRTTFFVLDGDATDYSPEHLCIDYVVGMPVVTFEQKQPATLTYKLYWAKDGVRLNDYTAIKTFTADKLYASPVQLNLNIFSPKEANQIELVVMEGHSQSVYADIPKEMFLSESEMLYSFNVISDIHAYKTDSSEPYTSHFIGALKQIDELDPNSEALFTVGDNTGNGKEFEYDVLAELLSTYRKSSSPIYYTIGNHDYMYYDTIEEGLDLFKKRLGMKNHYYSVEIKGIKFIILGSDTTSGYGSLSEAQLNWLENELKTAASNKPIFIMIHQPLKNTVAGTLDKLDPNQTSAGFIDSSGTKLRKILKSYPNSFVFTGHSHWTMDSYQSTYVGVGHDANFINCSSVAAPEDGSGRLAGSQGVFVEVYEDFVVIKGRDFVKNAWISSNQIIMKLEKEEQQ